MTEDFNEGPPAIEDKQSVIDYIEDSSLKIEHIECAECRKKFSNVKSEEHQKQIVPHLKEFNHNSINIINEKKSFKEVKCSICSEKNIFRLFILIKGNEDKNVLDFKNIVFCKTHAPKGFILQSVLDILEFDEIINRKLNKVILTYETKYDYYQIYKPLSAPCRHEDVREQALAEGRRIVFHFDSF